MEVNKDKHVACEIALLFFTDIYGSNFNTFDQYAVVTCMIFRFQGMSEKEKSDLMLKCRYLYSHQMKGVRDSLYYHFLWQGR